MATETLTVTTATVTKAGERVTFPYASGQPAGTYSAAGAVLKSGSTTLTIGFGVSFERDGVVVTPAASCEIPAGALTLTVTNTASEPVDVVTIGGVSRGVGEWVREGYSALFAGGSVYTYIHFGDSLSQGDGDARSNTYGSRDMTFNTAMESGGVLVPLRNGGVGGQTSPQIAARVRRDVIKFRPQVVGCTMGTNDLTANDIANSLSVVTEACRSAGAFLFFTTIPPYSVKPAVVTAINAAIVAHCTANNIPCVDWYGLLNDPSNPGNYRPNYSFDAIHPTALTDRRMAALNWETISGHFNTSHRNYTAKAIDAGNLLFVPLTAAGVPVSNNTADPLFLNFRSFTQNGFTLPMPYLIGTMFSSGTAPTMTGSVASRDGVKGNVWSLTATPNGAGGFTAQTSASSRTVDLTRYQGRRLRFSARMRTSGFSVDNTDAYLAANANASLSGCGFYLTCRNAANAIIATGSVVDPTDSTATLGQASSLSFDYQALPFRGPGNAAHRYSHDHDFLPVIVEMNVPVGASHLDFTVGFAFSAGATAPVTMELCELALEDVGPARLPQLPVNEAPLGFLPLTAATTLTLGQIVSVGLYRCDATAGAFTITLPACALFAGRTITFKKIDASANAVTIDGSGSETIDGAATKALSAQYEKVVLYSNGTSWDVIG